MAREGRKGLYRCRMPFPEIRKYLEREIFLIGIKLNIFAEIFQTVFKQQN